MGIAENALDFELLSSESYILPFDDICIILLFLCTLGYEPFLLSYAINIS